MTGKELESYNTKLDYANFADTYFTSRRLLLALDWDNPYLSGWLRFKTSLIGQFDLSGSETLYNSQYLVIKADIPVKSFLFDLGACFEMAKVSDQKNFSFAGEFGVSWMPSASITDRLTLTGRYSGGKTDNGALSAFVPITTEAQGYIIEAKLSGLSIIRLDYTARLHQNILFNLANSYFILGDLETYKGLPYGRDGYLLGNEFYGRFIWSPFSDLRLNLGGGVFLPSMGDADSEGKAIWRLELNAVIVIF